MGSSKKKKASSGKLNNQSSNNSANFLSPPPPPICYEGEELARLLSSIERFLKTRCSHDSCLENVQRTNSANGRRESARLVDPDLPYKIWLKQQFCVGVNDVTRVLERMPPSSDDESSFGSQNALRHKAPPVKLQAILLASDCIPRWLTRHLPSLASSKKVPLIHVKDKKGGSLRLGELVKLRTAIAVGVKVRGTAVNQIIEEVLQSEETKVEKLL